MSIESSVAALTTATTALTGAVLSQQTAVASALAGFSVTTSRVATGLNNVNNTPDTDKPVSTAQKTALDTKQNSLVLGLNISLINGQDPTTGIPILVPRGPTTLNSVSYDNRGSLRFALTPAVDDTKVVEGLGIFMWTDSQLQPDEDETCFSTATGQWLLAVPAFDLLDAWSRAEQAVRDEFREDEPTRIAAYLTARGL